MDSKYNKYARVRVYKNNKEVGWYKNTESGVNAVKATCEKHSFDITDYEFRDYITDEVVWRGDTYDGDINIVK